MTKDEIKKFVADLLNEGVSLSDIQKRLQQEKEINITFLDLRLMASEMSSIDWSKQNKTEKTKNIPNDNSETINDETTNSFDDKEKDLAPLNGTTSVELSRLARPGALAHGSVTFISGIKADWILDEMGRLGLEKTSGTPTEEDLKGFQEELQKSLSGGRYG